LGIKLALKDIDSLINSTALTNFIRYEIVYFLMESKNFVVFTSIIIMTMMTATTIGSGALNTLSIQNASAQTQTGANSFQSTNSSSVGEAVNGTSSSTINFTGSIPISQILIDAFKVNILVSLGDAIATAEDNIGNNSTTIAAFIHPEKGFVVYNIFTVDSNNDIHKVIIDPGDGSVLSSQKMTFEEMMWMVHGVGGSEGMKKGHGMGMAKQWD
jgi:hypothetical protein